MRFKLHKLFNWLRNLFKNSQPQRPSPSSPIWETPVLEEMRLVKANRALRRAYERARRRRDKLVAPVVPEPIVTKVAAPKPRRKKKEQVETIELNDPNDKIIADELIEGDGQGKVLFEESEFYGEFNFRDSILEQLDRYWVYLERMKKHDSDAYGFYKAVGATLVPYSCSHANRKWLSKPGIMTADEIEAYKKEICLPAWFLQHRPAFGCIAVSTDPLTEKQEIELSKKERMISAKFVFFLKLSEPAPEIQHISGGDTYKMTIWWDRPFDPTWKGGGTPTEVGVFVSADGKRIQILRVLETKMVKVSKKGNNFDYSMIPQRAWRIPNDYEHWARQHGLDAQTFLAHVFCGMIREFEYSNLSMIRVNVTNDKGLTAVFGLSVKRIPYFFQDRDVEWNDAGTRKRIFHFVRPHIRADGKPIKAHFRGSREFTWAGYHVLITVPAKDHIMLTEIDKGVIDEYWMKKDEKYITEPEFGKMLSDIVHGKR